MGYNEYILCNLTIANISEDEYLWLKDIFDVDIDINGSINELVTTGTISDIDEPDSEVLNFLIKAKKYCTSDCDIFPMFYMKSCDDKYPSDFYFENRGDYSKNIEADMCAMSERDGQRYVRVLEGQAAREIAVQPGLRGDEGRVEIKDGLTVGQQVILGELTADEYSKLQATKK
jgi:hypothetical protein